MDLSSRLPIFNYVYSNLLVNLSSQFFISVVLLFNRLSIWFFCCHFYLFTCDRQNNALSPKDVDVLFHETYEYVMVYGKRDFAGVIKLKILN